MRFQSRRFVVVVLISIFVLTIFSTSAVFADYPRRPITLILPLPPGGTTDIVARLIANKMEEDLGVTINVINRAGANGTIAVAEVARSNPDGYTFGAANLPTLTIHDMLRDLPYNREELVYIGTPIPFEYMVVARKDAPYDTWEEFVEFARNNPGLKYGTPGIGSTNHLGTAYLVHLENLDMEPVPYDGNAPSLAAMLAGDVEVINSSLGTIVSPIRAGEIKPLIITSEFGFGFAPDVPLSKDLYEYVQYSNLGFFFPPETPIEYRDILEESLSKAIMHPEVQERLDNFDIRTDWRGGEEYKALLDEYYVIWGDLMRLMDLID